MFSLLTSMTFNQMICSLCKLLYQDIQQESCASHPDDTLSLSDMMCTSHSQLPALRRSKQATATTTSLQIEKHRPGVLPLYSRGPPPTYFSYSSFQRCFFYSFAQRGQAICRLRLSVTPCLVQRYLSRTIHAASRGDIISSRKFSCVLRRKTGC